MKLRYKLLEWNKLQRSHRIDTNEARKIYVIFDVDDAIAQGFAEETIEKLIKERPWLKYFLDNNLCLYAPEPHIIYPGVIEFIQVLDKHPEIIIAFFSARKIARLNIFVEKLLLRALGAERYHKIKSNVIIRSTQDDIPITGPKLDRELFINYGLFGGHYKKDLMKVVPSQDDLDWSALFEDQEQCCYYNQAKNLILIYFDACDLESVFSRSYRDGKSNNFFRAANIICHAAGIFFTALEMTRTKPVTLKEALYQLQYIVNRDPRLELYDDEGQQHKVKMVFNKALSKQVQYFEMGKNIFNQINPDFNFITFDIFSNAPNCISKTASPFTRQLTRQNI